jgi:uncharacterized protein (DUF1778 family)
LVHRSSMGVSTAGSRKRLSITMTSSDREFIETAAKSGGMSAPAWIVQVAREEARWAVARQMASELAAEAGVTAEDLAWARSVLGLDAVDE